MISRCERGLGWPSTSVDEPGDGADLDQIRKEIVKDLEDFRDYTYGPSWKPHRAAYTLAIMVVQGLVRRKR